MGDNLNLLEQRVDQAASLIDELREDNAALARENARLKTELAQLQQQCRDMKIAEADRSTQVKERLHTVLSRIEELENLQAEF